jgi:hypothetical protein
MRGTTDRFQVSMNNAESVHELEAVNNLLDLRTPEV